MTEMLKGEEEALLDNGDEECFKGDEKALEATEMT